MGLAPMPTKNRKLVLVYTCCAIFSGQFAAVNARYFDPTGCSVFAIVADMRLTSIEKVLRT
jgi:hypothetical protein